MEPFLPQLPSGCDTEPLAAGGREPTQFVVVSYPIYFVFSQVDASLPAFPAAPVNPTPVQPI